MGRVIPPAIIYVNDDISATVEKHLVSQLSISKVMDGYDFDARVACDPNFLQMVKALNLRIMVKRNYRNK